LSIKDKKKIKINRIQKTPKLAGTTTKRKMVLLQMFPTIRTTRKMGNGSQTLIRINLQSEKETKDPPHHSKVKKSYFKWQLCYDTVMKLELCLNKVEDGGRKDNVNIKNI
jgi:hypothetical protein